MPSIFDVLQAGHDMARARFDKISEMTDRLSKVRMELDKLTKLGDMVTPEDVTKSAGAMIGHGISAPAMAKILSDMPSQGGLPLKAWIDVHDANMRQREAELIPVREGLRHEMGIAASRLVTAHSIRERMTPSGPPAEGPNQLTPPAGGPPNAG